MPRRRTAPAPATSAWIFDLLFSGGAGATRVTWAPAGELPAGFERAEQFGILPAIAGRSFAVSLASRVAAASALTSYNALRTAPRRMVRNLFSAGLRTGLVQLLMRGKIDIGIAAGARAAPGELLTEQLRQRLRRGPVVVAFGGSTGPYRKPVLQVFALDGTPVGYVKVGWNEWTRAAVRREAAALRACAARPLAVGVPELMDLSSWRGLDMLITAPLPAGVRRLGLSAPLPAASLLREIIELTPPYVTELADSPWWRGLRARIEAAAADPAAQAQLRQAAAAIERRYGQQRLEFGSWHGDLVPWNMALLDGRLYAWDWESSSPDVPVGFDALHYYLQLAFVARRRPLPEAAALASRRARAALEELGVATATCGLVAALHLMELFVQHEEARGSSGEHDARFYPAVAQVLRQSLTPRPGAVLTPDAADRAI